jgi:hypothetical protein
MNEIPKATSNLERLSPQSTADFSPHLSPEGSTIGDLANHQVQDTTTKDKKTVSFNNVVERYKNELGKEDDSPFEKVTLDSQLSGPASAEVINLSREITEWASQLTQERAVDSKKAKDALTYLEKNPEALKMLQENTKQELKAWSRIADQRAANAEEYISLMQLRSQFLNGESVNSKDLKKADSHIYCGTKLEDLKEDWEAMKQDEKWAQEDTKHIPIKKITIELARKHETSTQMELAKDTMRAMASDLKRSMNPKSSTQKKSSETPPAADTRGSEHDSDPDSQRDVASPSGRYRMTPEGTPDYETGPLDMHGDPFNRF